MSSSLFTRAASLELRGFETRQHMRLRIENNICERDVLPRRKEKVQVLQSLGVQEILH